MALTALYPAHPLVVAGTRIQAYMDGDSNAIARTIKVGPIGGGRGLTVGARLRVLLALDFAGVERSLWSVRRSLECRR
jgi:hypothetical protein